MTKEDLLKLKEEILSLENFADVEKLMPKQSAYSFLVDSSKDRLDQFAINYFGRKYTYKELIEKIDECAKGLSELGVKKGDFVSVSMLMTPEALITFYALSKIGAVAHLVNILHNEEEVENAFKNTDSKIFITNDVLYSKKLKEITDRVGMKKVVVSSLDDSLFMGFRGDRIKLRIITLLKKISRLFLLDEKCITWKTFEKICENSNLNVEDSYVENMPLAIAYTSGSTGHPKAVLTSNEAFNSMPLQLGMTDENFANGDSIFTTMPTWIYYSLVNNAHNPLCLGVTLDMDPIFDAFKIHKRIKQYKFNHWNTIPAYLENFVMDKAIKGMDLSSIKSITTGGDFLSSKLKLQADDLLSEGQSTTIVAQGYGASEILGSFGYTYSKDVTPGSIGKPLVGNKFKILDLRTGEELGPNVSGELYLYSPSLMVGYYGNETATNKSIVIDENGIRWYKTEDLAHFNENGELFIDGRLRRIELTKDDKGNPAKIFPDKIKQIILQHPLVEKCEIVMIPNLERITIPVAYVVLKGGLSLDNKIISEILSICKENKLEKYALPLDLVSIDSMPLTDALKTDLNKLKEMYMSENKSGKKL